MTPSEIQFATERRSPPLPTLATVRLILRPPCGDDSTEIATLADDRRLAENTARLPHPYRHDDAVAFIAAANRHDREACFVITLDQRVIGVCSIEPRDTGTVLGCWLGPAYWGRGFATEAVRALIDHAFADRGCAALHAGARVSNPAARRVLEKCGFQWNGVRLMRIRAIRSAAPFDLFRLDCRLWASLKSWCEVRRVA